MQTTKKITKSTLKSFVNKNCGNLYIKSLSRFDGMVDMVTNTESPNWRLAEKSTHESYKNYDLGYKGIYCVHGSGNSFKKYNDGEFEGIEVYNCCGCFIVGKKI